MEQYTEVLACLTIPQSHPREKPIACLELLLRAVHLLSAPPRLHSYQDLGEGEPANRLLPVGPVHTGTGGAALLRADNRVETPQLAVRWRESSTTTD